MFNNRPGYYNAHGYFVDGKKPEKGMQGTLELIILVDGNKVRKIGTQCSFDEYGVKFKHEAQWKYVAFDKLHSVSRI